METPGAERRLVLVVDDEPMLRNLLSRLLRMEGYDVIEAEDGQAALDLIDKRQPDLVLLDVMLPARDGLDVLGDLRPTSEVPGILVSTLGEEADRVLGLKMGADDYVVKPFSAAELSARIESVLRRGRHPAAPGATNPPTFEGLAHDPQTPEGPVGGGKGGRTATGVGLLALPARS